MTSAKSPEEHAQNWDLRHEDFKDNDFLYDVYSVMRQRAPFAHTDTPFLGVTPDGGSHRTGSTSPAIQLRKAPSNTPATSLSRSTRHGSRSSGRSSTPTSRPLE
jgi:hypothetical protein